MANNFDFYEYLDDILKELNKIPPFATGGFVHRQVTGRSIRVITPMTDDEKIDYYVSRKILKTFGVEI